VPTDLNEWRWGKDSPLYIQHPVIGHLPLINRWTGPGLVEQSGGAFTVKQSTRDLGPSERMTVDFSDLDQSTLNLVTGQAGNFLSPYYMDQWKAWYEGTTMTLPFSSAAVERTKKHRLVLEP
jgi:penicillin amidase